MRSFSALILFALSVAASDLQQSAVLQSATLVNQAKNNSASSSVGITVTIASAAQGDLLVVFVTNNGAPPTVTGIVCTNVTFVRLTGDSTVENNEIWWGVVTGGASGTSVVVAMSVGTVSISSTVAQFNSPTGWNGVDGIPVGNNATASSTATTAAYSSTVRSLILISVGNSGSFAASSPGGIFTDLTAVAQSSAEQLGSYAVANAGAKSATWTFGGGVNWSSAIGGIKLGGSSASTPGLWSHSGVRQ